MWHLGNSELLSVELVIALSMGKHPLTLPTCFATALSEVASSRGFPPPLP